MNSVLSYFRASSAPAQAFADVLSADDERRHVELAFLKRHSSSVSKSASKALRAASKQRSINEATSVAVEATYNQMRSAVFVKMARAMEKDVPQESGFGRFKEGS